MFLVALLRKKLIRGVLYLLNGSKTGSNKVAFKRLRIIELLRGGLAIRAFETQSAHVGPIQLRVPLLCVGA